MLEPYSHPYKLTIKIEPCEEGSKLPSVQKEFVMMKSEAEEKFYALEQELTLSLKIGQKVLITSQSKSSEQYGVIIGKTIWGGYDIEFPNGLAERWDKHTRSFHRNFIKPRQ